MLTLVTYISSLSLSLTSLAEAVSKNSSRASLRLSRASSKDSPWLAMSSSGHRATYPSPSRSMIAVMGQVRQMEI